MQGSATMKVEDEQMIKSIDDTNGAINRWMLQKFNEKYVTGMICLTYELSLETTGIIRIISCHGMMTGSKNHLAIYNTEEASSRLSFGHINVTK